MPLYLIVREGKPGYEAPVAWRKATSTSWLVLRTLLDGIGRRLSRCVPALLNLPIAYRIKTNLAIRTSYHSRVAACVIVRGIGLTSLM